MTSRLVNPALLPLIAALLLAADVDGLDSVRVELTETEFVHHQPQQGGNSFGFFDSPKLGDIAQSWVISPLSLLRLGTDRHRREGGDHQTLGYVTQLWAVKKSN